MSVPFRVGGYAGAAPADSVESFSVALSIHLFSVPDPRLTSTRGGFGQTVTGNKGVVSFADVVSYQYVYEWAVVGSVIKLELRAFRPLSCPADKLIVPIVYYGDLCPWMNPSLCSPR